MSGTTLPGISIGDAVVYEPRSGRSVITFAVTLDAASDETVTVNWATGAGSGGAVATGIDMPYGVYPRLVLDNPPDPSRNIPPSWHWEPVRYEAPTDETKRLLEFAADYLNASGFMTFAPGQVSQFATVEVLAGPVLADAARERFAVMLSDAVGAEIVDGSAVGEIIDSATPSDEPPTMHGASAVAGSERLGTLAGGGRVSFTVSLNHAYSGVVTVDYATKDGTAVGGLDYVPVSGTLTFAPGELDKVVEVEVLADDEVEPVESLTFELSNVAGATLAWAETAGSIQDAARENFALISDGLGSSPLAGLYRGPVAGIAYELVTGAASDVVRGTSLGDFVNLKAGTDAVDGAGGNDVLDGGTGSNFLTGGAGVDTFFVDAREAGTVWSTVTDFSSGEATTFWGINAADFVMSWADGLGAPGYTGLTLTAEGSGITAALTLTGYSVADLTNGKLATAFGHEPVSGSDYFYIYAV